MDHTILNATLIFKYVEIINVILCNALAGWIGWILSSIININSVLISDGLRDIAFNGSTDVQLQSMKGAIGIRINGVNNFKIQSWGTIILKIMGYWVVN